MCATAIDITVIGWVRDFNSPCTLAIDIMQSLDLPLMKTEIYFSEAKRIRFSGILGN